LYARTSIKKERTAIKDKIANKCLIDVIGIRIVKSGEYVIILYRGAWKVGFIYEGEKLTEKQILRVFSDVPNNANDLKNYRKEYDGKVEILTPKKDNYVFIGEYLVQKVKPK
jgi:hypothetical protein